MTNREFIDSLPEPYNTLFYIRTKETGDENYNRLKRILHKPLEIVITRRNTTKAHPAHFTNIQLGQTGNSFYWAASVEGYDEWVNVLQDHYDKVVNHITTFM